MKLRILRLSLGWHGLLACLVSITILVVSGIHQPPSAIASTDWVPPFNPAQHVYVDPDLAQHPTSPVAFEGLSEQLTPLMAEQNLQVYVIADQGETGLNLDTNWATERVSDVVERWEALPEFPRNDYLLVYWVRRTDDLNKGWVAANAGDRPYELGVTENRLADPEGPVIRALKEYMPHDPQGAMVAVVRNVNRDIEIGLQRAIAEQEAAKAAQERAAQRQAQMAELKRKTATYLPLAGFGAITGTGSLLLLLNYRKRRRAADSAISDWQERLEKANALYLKLYDQYFGFLKVQSDWADSFKGDTLEQYQAAVTDFSDFTVQLEAANQRLQAAQAARQGNRAPLTAGLVQAHHLLTQEPIVITGQELPLEMAQLFSDVVPKTTYQPEQLLAEMSELFNRTNQTLARIMQAVADTQANLEQIAQQLAAIATTQQTMADLELPFAPYEERLQLIQHEQVAVRQLQPSDPLTACPRSQECVKTAEALQTDLNRAIALNGDLHELTTTIQQAEERVRKVRSQLATYSYPLEDRDEHPDPPTEPFRLDEPNHDPDTQIAEAKQHQKVSFEQLLAGHLDIAQAERDASSNSVQQTHQLIDDTLAAKEFTEQQVPTVRQIQHQLQQEIPPAQQVLQQLEAEFLSHNFVAEPGKLKTAIAQDTNTTTALSHIQQAYGRQHYLAAREVLEPLADLLQTNRQQLNEIHQRLAQLQDFRRQSREVIEQCQSLSITIAPKFQTYDFTTSAETESVYQDAIADLNRQHADVEQDITDWERAASEANQLLASFQSVDQAIAAEHQSYEQLKARFAELEHEIEATERQVRHPDTRPDTSQRFADVQAQIPGLAAQIGQPKSDWNNLLQDVSAIFELVYSVQHAAEQDHQAAEEARAAIRQAQSALHSANRTYKYGIHAQISPAQQFFSEAEAAIARHDYALAKTQAEKTAQAAQSAEREANQKVQQRSSSYSSSSSSRSSRSSGSSYSSSRSSRSSGSSYSSSRSKRSGGGGY
ncbi:MAG: hypothetical protein ACTS2F_10065 [Thainema sp.]